MFYEIICHKFPEFSGIFPRNFPGKSAGYFSAERLSFLKLQSLEHRRLIADLTVTYNILHDKVSINNDLFTLNPNKNLRGHPLKITVPVIKTNVQKFFFSNRVIAVWNSLPTQIVLSKSTFSFKNQLKKIDLSNHLIFRSIYEYSLPL